MHDHDAPAPSVAWPTRRGLLGAMAGLLGGAKEAYAAAAVARPRYEKPMLVAYFSRSGNTRVVAGLLSRSLGAELFEIVPATPYPEDYLQTVALATQQRDQGALPPLAAKQLDIAPYATVFLGLPIWGGTAPPIIRSFLSAHDLAGKTVVPFITHGGYGLGSSESVIARHSPKAKLGRAFVMEGDQ